MKTSIRELLEVRVEIFRYYFVHAPYPRELSTLTLQGRPALVTMVAYEQVGERMPERRLLTIQFSCLQLDDTVMKACFLFHGNIMGENPYSNSSTIQGFVDGHRRGMFFFPHDYDLWILDPPRGES